eukprot:scaffold134_cov111-Isochrysis_galbana.AAC.9
MPDRGRSGAVGMAAAYVTTQRRGRRRGVSLPAYGLRFELGSQHQQLRRLAAAGEVGQLELVRTQPAGGRAKRCPVHVLLQQEALHAQPSLRQLLGERPRLTPTPADQLARKPQVARPRRRARRPPACDCCRTARALRLLRKVSFLSPLSLALRRRLSHRRRVHSVERLAQVCLGRRLPRRLSLRPAPACPHQRLFLSQGLAELIDGRDRLAPIVLRHKPRLRRLVPRAHRGGDGHPKHVSRAVRQGGGGDRGLTHPA